MHDMNSAQQLYVGTAFETLEGTEVFAPLLKQRGEHPMEPSLYNYTQESMSH